MNIVSIRLLFFIFSIIVLQACASFTYLDVNKVKDNTAGVRYFLPQTYIMVTPKSDGGVDVERVLLPDPKHQYAIDTKSYFGSYTIDINRSKEGFLETVTLNSDSTGVAKKLIEATASLEAAKTKANSEDKKTVETKAKEALDGEKKIVEAVEGAVKEAELSLEIARRKLELLENIKGTLLAPGDINDRILDAQLAFQEAKATQIAAVVAFDAVMLDVSAANAPATGSDVIKAPEPVFFRVEMEQNNVKLVRDVQQLDLETWRVPKDVAMQPDLKINFSAEYSKYVRPDSKTKALSFKVESNRSLLSVTERELFNQSGDDISLQYIFTSTLKADGRVIVIDLPKSLPKGEYSIGLVLSFGKKESPIEIDKLLKIQVEK